MAHLLSSTTALPALDAPGRRDFSEHEDVAAEALEQRVARQPWFQVVSTGLPSFWSLRKDGEAAAAADGLAADGSADGSPPTFVLQQSMVNLAPDAVHQLDLDWVLPPQRAEDVSKYSCNTVLSLEAPADALWAALVPDALVLEKRLHTEWPVLITRVELLSYDTRNLATQLQLSLSSSYENEHGATAKRVWHTGHAASVWSSTGSVHAVQLRRLEGAVLAPNTQRLEPAPPLYAVDRQHLASASARMLLTLNFANLLRQLPAALSDLGTQYRIPLGLRTRPEPVSTLGWVALQMVPRISEREVQEKQAAAPDTRPVPRILEDMMEQNHQTGECFLNLPCTHVDALLRELMQHTRQHELCLHRRSGLRLSVSPLGLRDGTAQWPVHDPRRPVHLQVRVRLSYVLVERARQDVDAEE